MLTKTIFLYLMIEINALTKTSQGKTKC